MTTSSSRSDDVGREVVSTAIQAAINYASEGEKLKGALLIDQTPDMVLVLPEGLVFLVSVRHSRFVLPGGGS